MIEIRNLNKKIDGNDILKNINLVINDNETVVLSGENGSGKSILAKLILGLDDYQGNILINGIDIHKYKTFRQEVGFVFQDAENQIIGSTVLEDVMFGLLNFDYPVKEAEKKALNILQEVGLIDKKDFIPLMLSGGERRRLSIASVIVLEPKYIFFDEPFANLDWRSITEINKIIINLKKNHSLVIITHELEKILKIADKLVILYNGSIALNKPTAEAIVELKTEFNVKNPFVNYQNLDDLIWI